MGQYIQWDTTSAIKKKENKSCSLLPNGWNLRVLSKIRWTEKKTNIRLLHLYLESTNKIKPRPLSPLDNKKINPVNPKGNELWIFIGRNDAKAEAPILWPPHVKSLLFRKDLMLRRLRAGGEGGSRGWDDWMISLTRRTWVWANSVRQWRTGKPGVLQSTGSQRVRHNLVTEQQQNS